MTYTDLDTSKAIHAALPEFETQWWHWYDRIGGTRRGIHLGKPQNPQGGWLFAPALTLEDAMRAIAEQGKEREWEKACKFCGSLEYDPGYSPSTTDHPEEYNPYCKQCGAPWMDGYEFDNGAEVPRADYELHRLLDIFLAANMDMSHPTVSEYLCNLFKEV